MMIEATALSPMHPGELLREEIRSASGMKKSDMALRLGVSRQTLHTLLSEEQPVTANMALRLAALFGNSPCFWLALQTDYDIATLGPAMAKDLAQIEVLRQ